MPPTMVVYIVQAPWGDKLIISRRSRTTDHYTEGTFEIIVYKCDPDGEKLIKMTGICDFGPLVKNFRTFSYGCVE
jgi:hypothetical protein